MVPPTDPSPCPPPPPAGVELLLLILKAKRAARTSALKCLDFATSGCAPACERVVDQQGLKTLFAIFMGKLKVWGWGGGAVLSP